MLAARLVSLLLTLALAFATMGGWPPAARAQSIEIEDGGSGGDDSAETFLVGFFGVVVAVLVILGIRSDLQQAAASPPDGPPDAEAPGHRSLANAPPESPPPPGELCWSF